MKFRHEYKHQISFSDYLTLKNRLRMLVPHDRYAGKDGKYRIRSLYFDNFDDKALREKIYGVNCREKFRIRYYNDNDTFINLEKKSKMNGLCHKASVRITKEEAQRIVDEDIAWMRDRGEILFQELYTKMKNQMLRPKTIVDYEREPFVYKPGNVRITIDKNIRTGLSANQLFERSLPTIPAGEPIILLEVKYDEFLPEIIADIVQLGGRRSAAFSKYAVCRIYG